MDLPNMSHMTGGGGGNYEYGAVESWESADPATMESHVHQSPPKKHGRWGAVLVVSMALMGLAAMVAMVQSGTSQEGPMKRVEEDYNEVSMKTITGAKMKSDCPYAHVHHQQQQGKEIMGMAEPKPPLSSDAAEFLGPLASLVGTWEGNGGLSVVAMPSPDSYPEDKGKFTLVVRPYKEVLTISPLGDPVRNRGGFIEQYSGVVTYYKEVIATDDEPGTIHIENGMLFYLENIQDYDTGEQVTKKKLKAPYPIARSATVPHGNVAFLFGSHKTSDKSPKIPDIESRALNSGKFHKKTSSHYDQPYEAFEFAKNPNGMLQQAIMSQNITQTIHLSLDSKNGGSITNTPFIDQNANTTGFQSDLWIETVMNADGSITEQLQYSEFVDIVFHKPKGKHHQNELISWPHVNVNTLTKAKE